MEFLETNLQSMGIPYFIVGKIFSDLFRSFLLFCIRDGFSFFFMVGTMFGPITKLELGKPFLEKSNRQVPWPFVLGQQSEV